MGYIKKPDIQISFNDIKYDFNNLFEDSSLEKSQIISMLSKYVPDFLHIEKGKNLDQKM